MVPLTYKPFVGRVIQLAPRYKFIVALLDNVDDVVDPVNKSSYNACFVPNKFSTLQDPDIVARLKPDTALIVLIFIYGFSA